MDHIWSLILEFWALIVCLNNQSQYWNDCPTNPDMRWTSDAIQMPIIISILRIQVFSTEQIICGITEVHNRGCPPKQRLSIWSLPYIWPDIYALYWSELSAMVLRVKSWKSCQILIDSLRVMELAFSLSSVR